MTGLFAENGPVRYFLFLAENKGSFSRLLIVFSTFSSLDISAPRRRSAPAAGAASATCGTQHGQVVPGCCGALAVTPSEVFVPPEMASTPCASP